MYKKNFFPGWHSSYLSLLCDHLIADTTTPIADFSGITVVVPTAEAGRLLREEMAARFNAVTSLQVVLPEFLLPIAENTATDAQITAAWLNTLRRSGGILSELYHMPGSVTDSPFLLAAAAKLQELRLDLAGAGMSLRDALAKLESGADHAGEFYFDQRDRFRALIALEDSYLKSNPGMLDPVSAYLDAVNRGGITGRVIIAGCLELKESVIKCLEASPAEVEVLTFAPATHAADFDTWGRPLPHAWAAYDIGFNIDDLRRLKNQSAQAQRLAGVLKRGGATGGVPSVLGIIDPAIGEYLLDIGTNDPSLPAFFQPGNDSLSSQPLTRLFCSILDLSHATIPFRRVAELARNIFVQRAAAIANVSKFLTDLDRCQKEHLISDFPSLRRVMANDFTELLLTWHNRLTHTKSLLSDSWEIFSALLTAAADEVDTTRHASTLTALRDLVAEAESAAVGMNPADAALLFRELLSTTRFGRESHGGEVELVGFFELVWRKESELIIAGMNEEAFNYGSGSGIFLPDAMRARLGMPTVDDAFAADIVRFVSLNANKRLKILYGKSSNEGDVLRPARLLLMCQREDLPTRAARLFGGDLDEDTPLRQVEYPPFLPYLKDPGNTMSVTGFSEYIKCPFGYYRGKVCGDDEMHDRNLELDAANYGTVVHEVLDQLMKQFPEQTDVDVMADRAAKLLDRHFQALNEQSNGILCVQKRLIGDSLKAFCALQNEYSAGWRVVETEVKHRFKWGELFHFMFPEAKREEWRDGVELVGTIDRADMREVDGKKEIRVLDYKTGSAKAPKEKHINTGKSATEEERKWLRVEGVDADKYWSDLQLPMYMLIQKYRAGDPNAAVSAGYFNLPVNCSDSELVIFTELEKPGVLESAVVAADFVMRSIFVDKRFWPPKSFVDMFDTFLKRLGGCIESDFLPQERWRRRGE